MASLFAAFEDVERLVARTVTEAASAVVESTSEYPKPSTTEPARHAKLVVPISTTQAVQQAKKAQTSWEDFDWQDQQEQWQDALHQLQDGSRVAGSDALSAAQLSQQLQELYEQLLSLPDPLPALKGAAALTAKTQELEASNRSLQQQVHSLQQDQTEVTQLLEDYRAEQAAHASLQAAYSKLQEELEAVKGAGSQARQLQQQVEEQDSTIHSLQATLASMRAELESSQSSLFEFMSKQEQAAGSASTAEQMAVEEMERMTAELLVLRKGKALLERQLQQQQQQKQQQQEEASLGTDEQTDSSAAAADGWEGDWAADGDRPAATQQRQARQLPGAADGQLAAAEAALAAAEEAARDQQHQIALLTTKLSAADARLERMTAELQRRPAASAVAAMTEQLAALSALTGKQLESEGWGSEAAAATVAAVAADPVEQLQPLLQERCAKLERALQAAKSEAAASAASAATTAAEVQALQQQLQQEQQLVTQLETDLLALSSSSSTANSVGVGLAGAAALGSVVGGPTDSLTGLEGLTLDGPGSADGKAAAAAAAAGAVSAAGVVKAAAAAGDAAVLQAVAAQRDRFKARIAELQAEQAGLNARLQKATADVDAVTKDNIALVEKIRFLERYKHGQGLAAPDRQGSVTVIRVDGAGVIHDVTPGLGTAQTAADSKAHRYSCGPLSVELPGKGSAKSSSRSAAAAAAGGSRRRQRRDGCFGMLGGDENGNAAAAEAGWQAGPEARYTKEYEARLNPFAEFQASESEARLRSMRLHDKALLAGSRLIAGSKLARAAIACYVLLLHCVIMALMYYSATPHVALSVSSSGSSSVPSAVAVAAGVAQNASLAAPAAGALAQAAAANTGGSGGGRLLLRVFSPRPVLPYT